MDGGHTLEDAQKAYEAQYRPDRLKLEDVEGFAQQLINGGLAQNDSPRAGKQLFEQRKKKRRQEWMQTFTNILYIKIPIIDPDRILGRMVPWLGWIFTPLFLMASIVLMGQRHRPGGRQLQRSSSTSCRTTTSSSVSRLSSTCGAPWRWSR